MFILNKDVLLLKAPNEEGNNKYESILLQHGFTVKYLQILDFQYVNLDILKNKLINHNDYTGIIFTSPRSVIATKKCDSNDICTNWITKNNYVVGESTFELTNKELNLFCKGRETGNANNLADLVISETSTNNKKYLFPCGNLKKEILVKRLKEHDITVDAVTVYETIKNKNLLKDFNILTENLRSISEYLVYFSPSGVKFLNTIFKDINPPYENIKLIAIGPSTEEELKKENLPVYAVATKPTETELLNAILNVT